MWLCACSAAAGAATWSNVAQAVDTYSAVNINSAHAITTPPNMLTDFSGQTVELSGGGGPTNLAYSVGGGNFVLKRVTDSVYAKASLESAELKTDVSLSFGSDGNFGSPFITPAPVGAANGSASAYARFADSFRTYDNNTNAPFIWSSGEEVTFQFGITGQTSVSPEIVSPSADPFFNPGEPRNLVYTQLSVLIFKPGTIDLLVQLDNFDFGNYPDFATGLEAFLELNDQIQTNTIANDYWYLGDLVSYFADEVDPGKIIDVDPLVPTMLNYSFSPGGDFDWVIFIDSVAQIDASLQNVSASLDFSSTINTTYQGPPGTTLYSASGLFPNTLPLDNAPSSAPVPEPATAATLGLAALALTLRRRR